MAAAEHYAHRGKMKKLILIVFSCLFFISCSFLKFELKEKPELFILEDTVIISPEIKYEVISDSTYGCIKGIIVDEDNKAIPFVNVILMGTEFGTQSNEAGEFVIHNIEAGLYNLIIRQVGYRYSKIENLELVSGKSIVISSITLQNKTIEIEKPIIYLYPETITNVKVQLDYNGKLLHTYPKYNKGWDVKAYPNGTLFDKNGKEYYALFWEGEPNKKFNVNEGFVISGKKTLEFLEETLAQLGLNRKEANEFIIYWLPKLESNPYNLIHFSTSEYKEIAELNIQPKPDTLIRVMMIYKPLNKPISINKQDISSIKKERKGFTVVEWGGCLLN